MASTSTGPPLMKVNVWHLYGEPFQVEVEHNASVENLREAIAQFLTSEFAINLTHQNIDLRAAPSSRLPGRQLRDLDSAGWPELVRAYGVYPNGAVLMRFRHPPDEGREAEEAEREKAAEAQAQAERDHRRVGTAAASTLAAAATALSPLPAAATRRPPLSAATSPSPPAAATTRSSPAAPTTRSPLRPISGYAGGRKISQKWDEDSIEDLVTGIERWNTHWARILSHPDFRFPQGANQVTLKDKWRNLAKAFTAGKTMRGVTLSEQLEDRIKALLGLP
mmetsp:Transcript_22350/g.56189  ORF Transcript_22350/g.56189 Transcript_22350/m.56189 type:complete len:279 (-) Transcript_22350:114-950(-)